MSIGIPSIHDKTERLELDLKIKSIACDGLKELNAKLESRLSAAEAALKEIAEHDHCDHPTWGMHSADEADDAFARSMHYKGVSSGHLCAAEIAKRYLEGK